MSLIALGGGPLRGDRLVRFVYLDESGLGKDDPYVVVAGPIVHADHQWLALETYLTRLMAEVVPPKQQKGFVFHAKELHHGEAWEPHEKYPYTIQRGVLKRICSIPERFDLPIVVGHVKRALIANSISPVPKAHAITIAGQTVAASLCAGHAELFMRGVAESGEVATLVYENNDSAKRSIAKMHNLLRDRFAVERLDEITEWSPFLEILPLERVVHSALFQEKDEVSILQIADACAFAARRKLTGIDSDGYFSLLAPKLFKSPAFFHGDYYSKLSDQKQFS